MNNCHILSSRAVRPACRSSRCLQQLMTGFSTAESAASRGGASWLAVNNTHWLCASGVILPINQA